jgi:peptide/nickel transport system substrate-binding protein
MTIAGTRRSVAAIVLIALGISSAVAGAANSASAFTSGKSGPSKQLTVNIGAEPGTLDVLRSNDGPLGLFSLSVYEGLTARTKTGALAPSLATSWTQKGKSWIFHLRHGVTFQNGQPLTAADVVASWQAVESPASQNRDSYVLADTTIKAVGKYTVVVSRPTPDPTTPGRASLVLIAPSKLVLATNGLDATAVGTGPYKFAAWHRSENITLARNANYWGHKAAISTVKIVFAIEPAVRLAQLLAGESQMVLAMPSALDPHKSQYKAIGATDSEVLIGRFNTKAGPFANKTVRLAAEYAIDRKAIINGVYSGHAAPANGQEVAPGVFGYSSKVHEIYPYNLATARSMLQQANSVGAKITVLGLAGRYQHDTDVGQAIAGMLTQVGFNVTLEALPASQFVPEYLKGQSDPAAAPDLAILDTSNQLFDASQTFNGNLTCAAPTSATCFKPLDAIVAAAGATLDPKKRASLYENAWKYAQNNAMYIAIAALQQLSFLTSNLVWQVPVDGFLRFQDMHFK